MKDELAIRAGDLINFVKENADATFNKVQLDRWIVLKYFVPDNKAIGKSRPYTLADMVVAAFIAQTIKVVDPQLRQHLSLTIRRMVDETYPEDEPIGEAWLLFIGINAGSNGWTHLIVRANSVAFDEAMLNFTRRVLVLPLCEYYNAAVRFMTDLEEKGKTW